MKEREQIQVFNNWSEEMINLHVNSVKNPLKEKVKNSLILLQYISQELNNQISIKYSEHGKTIDNILYLFKQSFKTAIEILEKETKHYLGKLSCMFIL